MHLVSVGRQAGRQPWGESVEVGVARRVSLLISSSALIS